LSSIINSKLKEPLNGLLTVLLEFYRKSKISLYLSKVPVSIEARPEISLIVDFGSWLSHFTTRLQHLQLLSGISCRNLGVCISVELKYFALLNSVALVRKRTIPTERPPLSAK
jgi:hypothetical protein